MCTFLLSLTILGLCFPHRKPIQCGLLRLLLVFVPLFGQLLRRLVRLLRFVQCRQERPQPLRRAICSSRFGIIRPAGQGLARPCGTFGSAKRSRLFGPCLRQDRPWAKAPEVFPSEGYSGSLRRIASRSRHRCRNIRPPAATIRSSASSLKGSFRFGRCR